MICVAQNDLFHDREKVPLRNYILSSKKLIKIKTTLQFYQFKWKSAHLTVECTFSVENTVENTLNEWWDECVLTILLNIMNLFVCCLLTTAKKERGENESLLRSQGSIHSPDVGNKGLFRGISSFGKQSVSWKRIFEGHINPNV